MIRSTKTIQVPEVPIHEGVLLDDLHRNKDVVAVVNGVSNESFTFGELHVYMRAVGSALTRLGIGKGDVVAIYSPNCPEYCVSCLGVWSIGAIVTGVNYNYTAYEVSNQVSDSRAKAIICSEQNISNVRNAMENLTTLKWIISIDVPVPGYLYLRQLMKDDGSAFPQVSFRPRDDLACIMYSSGTTGLPKGVMLSHYCLMANLLMLTDPAIIRPLPAGVQRVSYGFLPWFHMYGCMLMLFALRLKAKVVTVPNFQPEAFLAGIEKYKVADLHVVPPVVVFLAKSPLVRKYDLSSLRYVLAAAAPLTEDTEKEFLSRFKLDAIYQGYGLTEMTAGVTFMEYGKPRPGSSGVLCANTEAKVLSLETEGRAVGVGEEGEICVRSPSIMKGYLNRPEATTNIIDKDGWLHTGDIGYYDKDGYFFITGRFKELIKHKGFQVAPAELEGLLLRHPAVEDAAVLGVPDVSAGELPRAFIVRKPGVLVTEQDIFNFVKERLSRHKWLTGGVQFVSAIPKTPSGKIVRREVKKLLTTSKI